MDSAEQAEKNKSMGEEFWRGHLLAAEKFSGSDGQYCKEHGLKHGTFSWYKTKLGFSRACPKKKSVAPAFVEVKPQGQKVASEKSPTMPDAEWLAEFILILMRKSR